MSDKSDIDDDLRELLDELEETEVNAPEPPVSEPELAEPELLMPTDAREVADVSQTQTIQPTAIVPVEPEVEIIDREKFKKDIETVTDEVLEAYRADRQEAQDVINLLRNKIDDTPGDPPRMYIDGLVKIVEVKASISTNAIKMIEANAKVLASTKSKIGQQNNTLINGANLDLEGVLNQPIQDDDV